MQQWPRQRRLHLLLLRRAVAHQEGPKLLWDPTHEARSAPIVDSLHDPQPVAVERRADDEAGALRAVHRMGVVRRTAQEGGMSLGSKFCCGDGPFQRSAKLAWTPAPAEETQTWPGDSHPRAPWRTRTNAKPIWTPLPMAALEKRRYCLATLGWENAGSAHAPLCIACPRQCIATAALAGALHLGRPSRAHLRTCFCEFGRG